ncbi:hypothetical protein [Xanthocytophaga agilis]|uniref:Uncharacterized protein n=1 Tax=Xanthocytophaga agilis TaxID=3048010 RepID=A0AAE3R2M1_9BACT|nr:hypothetical protein [Xanthocytophaga agilis]MDJ1500494.1 hypothetical protein [Xanthocytophaga agilis]
MVLKVHNLTTLKRKRKPTLRVSRRGLFNLSASLLNQLGVCDDKPRIIIIENTLTKDYYLSATDSIHGIILRTTSNKKIVYFNSADLARKLFTQGKVLEQTESAIFRISETPIEYKGNNAYLIINQPLSS